MWLALNENLRHDAGQVEHLSGQVSHVAVHKDKKRLDDAGVGGETWGEGRKEPVDNADENATQWYHEEGDNSQEAVQHRHWAIDGKLLKKVVQNLQVEVKTEEEEETIRQGDLILERWCKNNY